MSAIRSQSIIWETASTPSLNSGWNVAVSNPQAPIIMRNLSSKRASVAFNLSKNNTTLDSPFTLPTGYRPAVRMQDTFFATDTGGIKFGVISINTAGVIDLFIATPLSSVPDQVSATIHYWLP